VTLNMVKLLENWSCHLSLRNEKGWQLYAGSQTRTPGTRQAQRPPTHSCHKRLLTYVVRLEIYPGCETRSLTISDANQVTERPQGAQAGGFWRSRRQRRKVL
jgi:hypothetical protein